MKRILCYGDSNTWGYDPVTKERLDQDARWTGVLRKTLGDGYTVIEEGLNGRTTVLNDPIEGYRNGYDYLIPCLDSHRPLDLVLIMLGTNDLKKRFSLSAYDIAKGAGILVGAVQKSGAGAHGNAPLVLLIAPPPIAKLSDFAEMFEEAETKSHKFSEYYHCVAEELGCAFFNAAAVIVSSDLDGIHLEEKEHFKLGQALSVKVKELIR